MIVSAQVATVTGEAATVFAALQEGFLGAGAIGHVVMTMTISNACPVSV
jgi:YKOF-related protein